MDYDLSNNVLHDMCKMPIRNIGDIKYLQNFSDPTVWHGNILSGILLLQGAITVLNGEFWKLM